MPAFPELSPLTGTVPLVATVDTDAKQAEVKALVTDRKDELKAKLPKREVRVNIEIELGGQHLRGELRRYKHRLVLKDKDNDDQVMCGPEHVNSPDLEIVEKGGRRWLIAKWELICELERSGESVKVRFLTSGSEEVLFGVEL